MIFPSAVRWLRRNPVGIQMIPSVLRERLFPGAVTSISSAPTPAVMDACRQHLKQHNLWDKPTTTQPQTDTFALPPLAGRNLDEHFHTIAARYYGPYLDRARAMGRQPLPERPPASAWKFQSGWTRYSAAGDGSSCAVAVAVPAEDTLVLDVEVLVQTSPYPVLAVAASTSHWYAWVSPWITGESEDPRHLIPLCQNNSEQSSPGLVLGHNIGFDRARVLDEYTVKDTRRRFVDTMSLHVAVSGLTSNQRAQWLKIDKELLLDSPLQTFEAEDLEWYSASALNSLQSVARFYLDRELDKDQRDTFVKGTREDVVSNFAQLVDYCATDVQTTQDVYRVVFPKFLAKKIQGNLVSFGGMLEMSSGVLPIAPKRWHNYIQTCEEKLEEAQSKVAAKLRELAEEYLLRSDASAAGSTDHYLRQLDWTPVGKNKLPKWYRQLIPSKQTEPVITIRTRITPLLLRMTWSGYPLYYLGKTFGWCYRVPNDSPHHPANETPVTVAELETAVKKSLETSKSGKSSEERFLALLQEDQHLARFYRLPNRGGADGENCGSPLSKSFLGSFSEGKMDAAHPIAREAILANASCSYWISTRDRIMGQFIVWPEDLKRPSGCTDEDVGILLPPIVPMGTVTRRAVERTWLTASNAKKDRIGSELKSNVVAPKGYCLVGADVDSQELWIASLFGDAQFGMHGATAFGWMTLQGSKADGTDLHSRSAQILGASRDHAKIFNYARIYGSGLKFSASLLCRCNPSVSPQEALQRAKDLYAKTKGSKWKTGRYQSLSAFGPMNARMKQRLSNGFWYGGTESFMFNSLEQTAFAQDPRTPVLGCQLPESLMSAVARRKYQTSCVNWVVQSSGVDYLHLLLTSMRHLIDTYKIQARLLITIHDEIRYLVKEEDARRAALALQISNIWTRAYFAYKCGMPDLPQSVAFFSAVDVDHVLRKEVSDKCVTPSQPEGVPEQGYTLTVYDLLGDTLGEAALEHGVVSSEMSPVVEENLEHSGTTMEQSEEERLRWLQIQMAQTQSDVNRLLRQSSPTTTASSANVHVIKGYEE